MEDFVFTQALRKEVLANSLVSAQGRANVVKALVQVMRTQLSFVGQEGLLVPKDLEARMAGNALLLDAALSLCDGSEPYDRVATLGVKSDVGPLIEGFEPTADAVELAEWCRNQHDDNAAGQDHSLGAR